MSRRSKRADARAAEEAVLAMKDSLPHLTKTEIASRLGVSLSSVYEILDRLGIEHDGRAVAASMRLIRHGTPAAWQYHGCRCEVCLDARREYKRAERRKRHENFRAEDYEHGLTTTYQAGCDCVACSEAMRTYNHDRNEATLGKAHAHREPWSEEEVRQALRRDLTISEISARIGRTYNAVSHVRSAARRGDPKILGLLNSGE